MGGALSVFSKLFQTKAGGLKIFCDSGLAKRLDIQVLLASGWNL